MRTNDGLAVTTPPATSTGDPMKSRLPILFALAILGAPIAASAQGISIGGRVGTFGFGGEAAVGLSDNLVIRGGIGSFFYEFDGDYDDIEYTVSPPDMTTTIGIDFYPTGGAFRFLAGMMFRNGDFTLESEDVAEAGGVEIGGTEYNTSGTLFGAIETRSAAPYLGIGFGNHTRGGFGFFLDLGVAFVGDADVNLEARGPLASVPGIQNDLAQEAQDVEDDAGEYLKYWPIVNLGVKIPIR